MFVDSVSVMVQAGDGGKGAVSFRREKYVERGGPDGGDGGNGGSVIVRAAQNQDTLAQYRYTKYIRADNGGDGGKRKRHGKNGSDQILLVPIGTQIATETGDQIADLTKDGQEVVVAQGGSGGYGNAHFISSVRQAPRVAEKGEKGEQSTLRFELKMIADVGLVGLPNAGKSTLLAKVSNAQPAIANYAFTTLSPNLGMVEVHAGVTLLFADIPGLIEGASAGKGLGDDFLRHIERTSVLIHLIDAYNESVVDAYQVIQNELGLYKADLTKKPQVIVLNKVDGLDDDIIADKMQELKKVVPATSPLVAISALSGAGIPGLFKHVLSIRNAQAKRDEALKKNDQYAGLPVLTNKKPEHRWEVVQSDDGAYVITGEKIEKFAAKTDFSNPHGVRRLKDIMKKMGIIQYLEQHLPSEVRKVYIGHQKKYQIDY